MGSHADGYSQAGSGEGLCSQDLLSGGCEELPGQPAPSWERVFSTELCSIPAPRDPLWAGLAGGTHSTGTDRSGGGWSIKQSSSRGPAHLHLLLVLTLTLPSGFFRALLLLLAVLQHAGIRAAGWIFTHCVSKQLQGCSAFPQPGPALHQHQTWLGRQRFPYLGPLMMGREVLSCRQALARAGIRGWGSLLWSGSGMLQIKTIQNLGKRTAGRQRAGLGIRNKINPIWSLPWVHHWLKKEEKNFKKEEKRNSDCLPPNCS